MARNEKTIALVSGAPITLTSVYTVPASTKTTLTGIHVFCSQSDDISIAIRRSGTDYYLFKAYPLGKDSFLGWSGQLILDTAGDQIFVMADTASNVDMIFSGWEKT